MADDEKSTRFMQSLDWLYDQAIEGAGWFVSAERLAQEYRPPHTHGGIFDADAAAQSLVRYQVAKAGTTGFLTGLGGLIVLPVMIPANLGTVWIIQLRMIAAVAALAGHDVKSDRVRTFAYICLTGSGANEIAREVGIGFGKALTKQAIRRISGETLKRINQRVGFRLLTKFGEKGLINLVKLLPLVGGVVGGTFDSTATYAIGRAARALFLNQPPISDDDAAGLVDE